MKCRPFARRRLLPPKPFTLELLESRIVPSNLNITPGGTATTLIDAGGTGEANGMTIVAVQSGMALVYVTDLNSDGTYQNGEITGIAVTDHLAMSINGDVNGDIATNLDSDGTLSDGTTANDGTALLDASINSLTINGGVGQILTGHDLFQTTVVSANEIRTGTAAGGETLSYPTGSPITLLPFTPEEGEDGGKITNLTVSAGLGSLTIGVGDGGDSTTKNGGKGGDFNQITIVTAGDVLITGGQGGDGFKRGGDGTEFDEFTITSTGGDIRMDAGGGGTILNVAGAKGAGGNAGDLLRGTLDAAGDVLLNTAGGPGGNATKQAGEGSSLELKSVTAGGNIVLMGTDGGSTPDVSPNLEGEKGRGGLGGHVSNNLNVFAELAPLNAGGTVTIVTGNGGSGGKLGANGGGVFGFDITAGGAVSITSGDGASFDPVNTTSEKGNGGLGGEINTVNISTVADVILTAGNGGGGSSTGHNGGSIGFIYVLDANDVTFIAGSGGGFTSAQFGDKQNTDTGGAGGGIVNSRVGGLPGDSITGDVTIQAGNGYGASLDVRRGGFGGPINDMVVVTSGNITLSAGAGGEAETANHNGTRGGSGGFIDPIELTGVNITVTAGAGGIGLSGGDGGEIDDLTLTLTGEGNIAAGNGGDAIQTGTYSPKTGGDGGDVNKILIEGTGFVRSIVAGSGGVSDPGGKDGKGGTVENVTFEGGTIGDFSAAYGVAGMGGIFAGSGLTVGDVISVHAAKIANIVAGTGSIPVPAHSIHDIVATAVSDAIGADLNHNGKFDFLDVGGGGAYDPATDPPMDGLVLAESIGTITGSTLYTLETGSGDSTGMVQPN